MDKRKLLIIYIILTLLLPVISFNVSADSDVSFYLSPDTNTVTVGEQFVISVNINSGTNVINTLAVNNLTFTSDYVEVCCDFDENVTYGDPITGFFDFEEDLVRLDPYLSEADGYLKNGIWSVNEENASSGTGYMYNITFNATAPGICYINLTDVGASYSDVANSTTISTNSTITIISAGVSPPAPFSTAAENRSNINVSWTHGTNATYTHVENNTSPDWEYGTGSLLYNGTGTAITHTVLPQGTTMYYQAWGWNDTSVTLSSTNSSDNAMTYWNLPVVYYDEEPDNQTGVDTIFDFNITLIDPDNTLQIDYNYEASNGDSTSGSNSVNGSHSFEIGTLSYDSIVYVFVNSSDEYSPENETYVMYNYTVRGEYQPDSPGVVATGYNSTQINLTWTDDTEADSTRVEWSATSDGTWEPNSGEHAELYNGTAELTIHSGLSPATQRFYKAWSWNNTDLVWSTGSTDNAVTSGQNLLFAGENPSNESTNVAVNITSVNITIYNSFYSSLNWTIQSGVGIDNANGEANGSKSCSVAGLQNNTTYVWYVNATEAGYDTNASYTFDTTEHPFQPNTPNPTNETTGVSVSTLTSWSGGDPDGDDTTYTVFFGDTSPPSLVSSNQSGVSYNPPVDLNYEDVYYWRVIAYDDKGTNITGPIWSFATGSSGPTPEDVGNVSINTTVGIGQTNATLVAFVHNYSDVEASVPCGFVYSTSTHDNLSSYSGNVSSGSYGEMTSYSDSVNVTGLTPSEYYYVRAWMELDNGYNISGEGYFLAKPNSPTNLRAEISGVNMALSWDPPSVASGTTLRTIVRYSKVTQPETIEDGTLGYNGTSDHITLSNLEYGTLYYYSAFAYISASGSPTLYQVSDDYDSYNTTTFSGEYNITLKWENTTHQLIDTTRGAYHQFIVYYNNMTQVNLFNATGDIPVSVTTGNWTNMTNGTFNITCPYPPLFFEFRWNDTKTNPYVSEGSLSSKSEYATVFSYTVNTTNNLTYTPDEIVTVFIYNSTPSYPRWVEIAEDKYTLVANQIEIDSSILDENSTMSRVDYYYYEIDTYVQTDYRCNRKIVPYDGQENVTFYLLTDKPVYGESSNYMNHSIVKYTYSFLDETGNYRSTNNPIVEIFKYDLSGNKLIIQREFFDSGLRVYPWLYYGDPYFVGVFCDIHSIARIGLAPTGDSTTTDIRIPYEYNRIYSFFDLIDLSMGYDATGIYVHYDDTTDSTDEATFYVYNYTSHALLHTETTLLSNYNFTYVCNTSLPYRCNIIATLDDIDDEYDGVYQVGGGACWIMLPDGSFLNTNVTNINSILTILFGKSPIFLSGYEDEVPNEQGNYKGTAGWVYIALFSIAFILFMSFGKLNGFLGTLTAGMFLVASGAFIEGMISTVVAVGMFIVIVGIAGLIGGVDKR